jgi:hypothetical protein
MIVTDFFSALQAGKELANARTWKQAQVLTSKLTVFASAAIGIAAAFGYPLPLTPEQIGIVAGAVGVLVGLFNGTATVVSTSRIGLPPRGDDVQPEQHDTEPYGGGAGVVDQEHRGGNGMARSDTSDDYPVPSVTEDYRG